MLRRDPNEAMIGGVCAGLASYFDIDTTLVRALFVASTLLSGFGLLLYVVLWVLLGSTPPPPPSIPPPPDPSERLVDVIDVDAGVTPEVSASTADEVTTAGTGDLPGEETGGGLPLNRE